MEILEIKNFEDKALINKFHQVARNTYKNNSVWASASDQMFDSKLVQYSNSIYEIMIPVIILEDDKAVARAVAFLTHSRADDVNESQGWIGFFECVQGWDNAGIRVLEYCENILLENGAKSIIAPKVDNQLLGLLVKGFDLPHMVYTNYNPPYYMDIFLKSGYLQNSNMLSFYFTRKTSFPINIKLPGFTTRIFNKDNIENEISIIHSLQSKIFSGRNGYVPRTFNEDRQLIMSMLPIIDDELIIIAENKKNEAVGILICLPDIYQSENKKNINRVRIISIGAVHPVLNKGLGVLMAAQLLKNILKKEQYVFAEGSWIYKDNFPPRNLVKRFNAKHGKEFILLIKNLVN
ncbi:MAG: hypothetical protein KAH95_01435 [Spirochaetales bacterium]|nr:hypothetical protein [Spirochaetales bacterium]